MRHYEMVLMIHPDQSEQVQAIIERYTKLVKESQGILHRFEDWGRRQLSYPIKNLHKAYYILMNVEVPHTVINEIRQNITFNDSIVRGMIIRVDKAITESSAMLKVKDDRRERRDYFVNEIVESNNSPNITSQITNSKEYS